MSNTWDKAANERLLVIMINRIGQEFPNWEMVATEMGGLGPTVIDVADIKYALLL